MNIKLCVYVISKLTFDFLFHLSLIALFVLPKRRLLITRLTLFFLFLKEQDEFVTRMPSILHAFAQLRHENIRNKTGVINDPLGQPTVPVGRDFLLDFELL